MLVQSRPELTILQSGVALLVALTFITACSFFKVSSRRNFSAIMLAGAGAAYLNGGLLGWEFAFCTVITALAFWGLGNYRAIAVGWVLHTVWDVIHHLYGTPIVPFVPLSSAGCAICDLGLALWYFQGAPSVFTWFRKRTYT
jgi:hypothetical protein